MTSKCDEKTESARARNRREFPEVARILDEFRAVFGDEVKLVYAEEGGKMIGKKIALSDRFITADEWLAGSERIRQRKAQFEGRMGRGK